MSLQVYIHRSLKHEHVVALLTHHFIDRSIAVVLEFCDNGSLRQLLSKTAGGLLTEPVSRRYFVQMFDAVSYLHASCIVHRDISVDKFLLDARDRVKLSNFGMALPYAAGDSLFTSRQAESIDSLRFDNRLIARQFYLAKQQCQKRNETKRNECPSSLPTTGHTGERCKNW